MFDIDRIRIVPVLGELFAIWKSRWSDGGSAEMKGREETKGCPLTDSLRYQIIHFRLIFLRVRKNSKMQKPASTIRSTTKGIKLLPLIEP